MKHATGKRLALCLSVVMLLSVLTGFPVAAADDKQNDMLDFFYQEGYEFYKEAPLEYVIYQGEAWITDCDNSISGRLEIPTSLGGYPVTTLLFSFSGFKEINEVIIPDTVTSINGDFQNCTKLQNVVIPNSVISFFALSFQDCKSLECVTLPDTLTKIPDSAFRNCNALASIILPASIQHIEARAFAGCQSLTDIVIPDNVTVIETAAFESCGALTYLTLPDSLLTIAANAFYGCSNLDKISLPKNLEYIGTGAFFGTGYYNEDSNWESDWKGRALYIDDCLISASVSDSYTIRNGTKVIAASAFAGCSDLKRVSLPDSLIAINDLAFSECKNLMYFNIPSNLKTIGNAAFEKCFAITELTITGNVQSIGTRAFQYCASLTKLVIADGVISIGKEAFLECDSLTDITIADSVTSIGASAFYQTGYYKDSSNWEGDRLFSLYIGNILIECGDQKRCRIKDGTRCIADNAFSGNDLNFEEVEIPNSVTHIGAEAFFGCILLSDITIPGSVVSIGEDAFSDCYSLRSITIPATVIEINSRAFGYYYGTRYYASAHVEPGDNEPVCTDILIYGHSESAAEVYAEENKFSFIPLKPATDPDSGIDGPLPDAGIRVEEESGRILIMPGLTAVMFRDAFPGSSVTILDGDGAVVDDDSRLLNGMKADIIAANGENIIGLPLLILMDVDDDGSITASDARLILRAAAVLDRLDDFHMAIADADQDKEVTAVDARKTLRIAANLDAYPVPVPEGYQIDYKNEYYGEVFRQYEEAAAHDFYRDSDFDTTGTFLNQNILQFVLAAGRTARYALYDIDRNGTPELLIGFRYGDDETDETDIYDIFTYANGKVYRFSSDIGEQDLGYRSYVSVNTQNNVVIIDGSGGAAYHEWCFYRYGLDGHTPKLLDAIVFDDWVYYRGRNEDTYLTEYEVANIWLQYTGYPAEQSGSDTDFDWQTLVLG